MGIDSDSPLVSIVTPVYNTSEFLAQCIESVLSQSYANFEYIILDNCSTDGSPDIAQKYSHSDSRIKVHSNKEFLGQVQNYNQAVRYISATSRYCKIVQADDFIFPDCIKCMVEVAETDEAIGMVGAFTLLDFGDSAVAYLSGLPYPDRVFDGGYVCRRYLADDLFVFGSPTATMLRSDFVRNRDNLFDEETVIDDTGLCMEVLSGSRFGYCHQVLTYTRRYNESILSVLKPFDFGMVTRYLCLKIYGRNFFDEQEFLDCEKAIKKQLRQSIGEAALRRFPDTYWNFLQTALSEVDERVTTLDKIFCMFQAALELGLNPKSTIDRLIQRRHNKRKALTESSRGDRQE